VTAIRRYASTTERREEIGVGHGVSRRRFLVIAAALCAPSHVSATDEAWPIPARFDPGRDAAADLAIALRFARAARRNVLIDVGGEWCSWCHILDRFFAANPDLRSLRDTNYVWLKVNFSKENSNETLLGRWPRITGYPHFFVLDGDGRLLHSQGTDVLEAGKNYDQAAMRAFLVKWAPPR
jgi:thiol:disulfide interchange protein